MKVRTFGALWGIAPAGPIQKITQQLQTAHKMDPMSAAQTNKEKCRAPLEAIKLKTPNPTHEIQSSQEAGDVH